MCWALLLAGLTGPSPETTINDTSGQGMHEASAPVESSSVGVFFSVLFFGVIDYWIVMMSKRKIASIEMQDGVAPDLKLHEIENEDVLFDLPLYLGLGGTVLGFVLISRGVSNSRDVAYISTIVGILASAAMRYWILRPARGRILSSGVSK